MRLHCILVLIGLGIASVVMLDEVLDRTEQLDTNAGSSLVGKATIPLITAATYTIGRAIWGGTGGHA